MIYSFALIDLGQCFERLLVALLFESDVRGNRFLDNPSTRTIQPRGQSVQTLREIAWNMRRHHTSTQVNT